MPHYRLHNHGYIKSGWAIPCQIGGPPEEFGIFHRTIFDVTYHGRLAVPQNKNSLLGCVSLDVDLTLWLIVVRKRAGSNSSGMTKLALSRITEAWATTMKFP